jgi:hypothetical protein
MQERVVQFAFESLLIGGLRLIEAIKRDVAPMSVVASNRFRADDEKTVLSRTLPGQGHLNTNTTVCSYALKADNG